VCCSVLQCNAVCCNVVQGVAACCSVLHCVAACCSVLIRVAMCCSVLQRGAICCSVLQCVAVCCSVLQCVAASCRIYVDYMDESCNTCLCTHTHTLTRTHLCESVDAVWRRAPEYNTTVTHIHAKCNRLFQAHLIRKTGLFCGNTRLLCGNMGPFAGKLHSGAAIWALLRMYPTQSNKKRLMTLQMQQAVSLALQCDAV